MNNIWIGLIIGMIMGWIITGLVFSTLPSGRIAKAEALRTACEATLPRDQQCVMQFIPEAKRGQ